MNAVGLVLKNPAIPDADIAGIINNDPPAIRRLGGPGNNKVFKRYIDRAEN